MKKINQMKRNYFIMTAVPILMIFCIVGIALSGDTSDGEIVEHEELAVYSRFISKKTEGKAFLIVEAKIEAEELYGNDHEFLGNYYLIYVGEKWEDHRANWYWFHVREDLKEILWCEIVECEYYSLEEWRDSLQYREQMERITEYLEENE